MFAERQRAGLIEDRRGGTAVEFAIVFPVFVAIVLGLFQFGWTQHCASSLRFALEQSSRALLLDPSLSQSSLQTMVQSKLTNGADPHVTVSLDIQTTESGERIARLTGVYPHTVGVPLLASFPVTYQTTVVTALPAA